MMRKLLIIGILFTSVSFGQGNESLYKKLTALSSNLGIPKATLDLYFTKEIPENSCSSLFNGSVEWAQKTELDFSGPAWLYATYEDSTEMDEFYMVLHRTPFNNFRSRINQSGFKERKSLYYEPIHVLEWFKDGIQIEAFMYKPLVGDVLYYIEKCSEMTARKLELEYVVVCITHDKR